MENKAKYTVVGFFVLSFSIAMIAFILWLARIDINKDDQKEYRLYITKSVSGLKPKSVVYYKGLEVGSVKTIQVNPTNLEEIEIILNVSKPHLVKSDTIAQIESQGVTGNKIIELSGGTQNAPLLQVNNDGFFVIPVKNTLLDNLSHNASNIGNKADLFLSKLNTLLNDKTMENVETLLTNVNNSTKTFGNTVQSVESLINKDIHKSLENIDQLTQNITALTNNVNQLIKNDIQSVIKDVKQTAQSAQNVDEVLVQFENTLIKLNNTVDNFNLNGGNMLFQTREITYGPGENRQ